MELRSELTNAGIPHETADLVKLVELTFKRTSEWAQRARREWDQGAP
jgi:hypothetical protein